MNVTDKYFDLLIERRVSVVVVVAAASRVARGNYKYLFGKCVFPSPHFSYKSHTALENVHPNRKMESRPGTKNLKETPDCAGELELAMQSHDC